MSAMSFGRRHPLPDRITRAPVSAAENPSAHMIDAVRELEHCANAATDLVAMLSSAYTLQERLQPECAIAAGAALTGEFALRATGVPLPEKGPVPANLTNDVLFAGAREGRPTAWMFLMHAAVEAGLASYEVPDIAAVAARIAVADGFSLSVPEQHVPHEWLPNVAPRFRYRVIGVADAHDLSLRAMTIALAAATGQLIIRTRDDLPPLIGLTLAAEIMLGAARMAPLPEAVTA
jgi:hypothetical protein